MDLSNEDLLNEKIKRTVKEKQEFLKTLNGWLEEHRGDILEPVIENTIRIKEKELKELLQNNPIEEDDEGETFTEEEIQEAMETAEELFKLRKINE